MQSVPVGQVIHRTPLKQGSPDVEDGLVAIKPWTPDWMFCYLGSLLESKKGRGLPPSIYSHPRRCLLLSVTSG